MYISISLADMEEHGFLIQTIQTALGEARDVLDRHVDDEPPLYDIQTLGDAAEDYVNIVATQERRVAALTRWLEEVRQ